MATRLSVAQARVFRSPKRFRTCVAGRRFGKSFLAKAELWRAATKAQKQNVMYCAPTLGMARDIMWDELLGFIPPELIAGHPNNTRMELELVNGSNIKVRGTQNYDRLRGTGLDFVVLDEFATIEEKAWSAVLRPALSDRMGKALFLGTPVGYNWGWELFNLPNYVPTAFEETELEFVHPSHYWESFQFSTIQGGNVLKREIEEARRTLPESLFTQEFLAMFTSLSGLVYSAFDPSINVDQDIEFDKEKPILLGIDFNVNPYTAVAAQIHWTERHGSKQKELHIFDEFNLANCTTPEFISEVKSRYGKHQIIAYPDASGDSRKTSAHETDHEMLKAAGFNVVTPRSNPYIVDRINQVNAMFRSMSGTNRCFVHPRCSTLKTGLTGLTYLEGTTLPDKSLNIEHITDALGYLINMLFPIKGVSASSHALQL